MDISKRQLLRLCATHNLFELNEGEFYESDFDRESVFNINDEVENINWVTDIASSNVSVKNIGKNENLYYFPDSIKPLTDNFWRVP